MDSFSPLILNALRRHRNQRRLTLEMLSAKVSMSPQHISEIESGKRDPQLSSIKRMAEAMGLTLLLAPDVRRYIANNGRTYTIQTGKATTAPETNGPDHAPQEA